ncbi:glutathione S-transferase family protein [Sphingobium nicotianae]|uniref:Glutathione S-transferase family protein n=1 Tax=Sphingobium nicotianae TaxID=2782607 RepID=A0A9X1DAM8_9SPHN|nr:glutathione S-transferase family protein [Sphingobium nicotianae]MBT2186535.1 glutathione S-transferase family protein [Sphingobium nicotianae]
MAGMVEGRWVASMPAAEEIKDGKFVRLDSLLRHVVSADPGAEFPAEVGRYHLWVAWGCPWAARTLAVRALKGLEEAISVSATPNNFGPAGWIFDEGPDGPEPGGYPLHRLYALSDPGYTGKVTVPTLWDKKQRRIVNNESAEIIRMFNSAFDGITGNRLDLRPEPLRAEIDRWNAIIYPSINNGVYRAGFATTQAAYEEAARELFLTLDLIDDHLGTKRYLAGEYCTEADWRLFVTLVRFDVGYYGAFKCNLRRIDDYPALSGYLRELYQWPGIAATVKLDLIKSNYWSLSNVNPGGIIPLGPIVDLSGPHGREHLPGKGISERD